MTPTHAALLNHASVTGATCCHPMSGRYCAAGRELWLAYRAECVATGGRATMETVRHQSPEWADEIKRRALILINGTGRKAA
jgi:hypothetical protein